MSVEPSVFVNKIIKSCLFVLYIARTECLYGISLVPTVLCSALLDLRALGGSISQESTVLSSIWVVPSVLVTVMLEDDVLPLYIAKIAFFVQHVERTERFA